MGVGSSRTRTRVSTATRAGRSCSVSPRRSVASEEADWIRTVKWVVVALLAVRLLHLFVSWLTTALTYRSERRTDGEGTCDDVTGSPGGPYRGQEGRRSRGALGRGDPGRAPAYGAEDRGGRARSHPRAPKGSEGSAGGTASAAARGYPHAPAALHGRRRFVARHQEGGRRNVD